MLLVALALTGALTLTGSGTCPSAQEVAALVAPAASDGSRGRFIASAVETQGTGGLGGGAVLLAAANRVDIKGTIVADGSPGVGIFSGPGGGSGGTILLEAPAISVSGSISARGGDGGDGAQTAAGGAGGGMDPPGDGADGPNGGGGGGAAGFIRVRTATCASTWPAFVPAPACETLAAGD